MPSATPYEKRQSPRTPYDERGLFKCDGDDPVLLKICDAATAGVGALSRTPLPVGACADLSVKMIDDEITKSYRAKVRWCASAQDSEANIYHYRVGLSIHPAEDKAQKAFEPRIVEGESKSCKRRVKGSMLIDFAKMILRNHDRPWQNYITIDDMEVLNDMIIPVAWYPLDTFRRAGLAVFNIFGGGEDEAARQWGRDSIDRIPADLYDSFFDKGSPKRAMRNYVNVNMRVFDFLEFKFNDVAENRVKITLVGEPEIKDEYPEMRLVSLMTGGALERIAQNNGAHNPHTVLHEEGSGDELMSIEIKWN